MTVSFVGTDVRQNLHVNLDAHPECRSSSQSSLPKHHHTQLRQASASSPASYLTSPLLLTLSSPKCTVSPLSRRIHSIIHPFSKTTETHVPPHARHSLPSLLSSPLPLPPHISARLSLTDSTNYPETQATAFTSPTQPALARSFHPCFRAPDWLSV